jgi:tetratricopeptide (TPR) repeat protein
VTARSPFRFLLRVALAGGGLGFGSFAAAQEPAWIPAAREFMGRVKEVGAALEEQKDRSAALLAEGRCEEANRALVEFVSEPERTAVHHFLLGNLLWSQDPNASFQFHELAYRAEAENPFVALEWALQLHRAGRIEEAERLYVKLSEWFGGGDPRIFAWRADCLLRLGRLEEAVEAWKAADVPEHHTSIEEGFFTVYGGPSPERRRCDLLSGISRGDARRIEELIELDLHGDTDWWNTKTRDDLLEEDLRLAAEHLGRESPRYRELALAAKHCRVDSLEDDLLDPQRVLEKSRPFAQALSDLNLLGEAPVLPSSSRVASLLFDRIVEAQLADAPTLLRWHGDELHRRADTPAGDLEAARILAFLYARAGDARLADLDLLGWNRYRDPRFAGSHLSSRGDALKLDDPLLKKALEDFPREPSIVSIALERAQRGGKPLRDLLAKYILGSLPRLDTWHDVKEAFELLDGEWAASGKKSGDPVPR